jgi:RNA polymerase sigma factor (sigma-70 family)
MRRTTISYFNYYYDKYVAMIHGIVAKHVVRNGDHDSMLSLARDELCFAISNFDRGVGAAFATYLYSRIDFKLRNARRESNRYQQRYGGIGYYGGNDPTGHMDNAILAEEVLSILSPKARMVVERCCMQGESLDTVANELGCSRSTVANIRDRATARMRERFSQTFCEVG